MPAGQQPTGHVRLAFLDDVLTFPCADATERLDQAGRINDIAADGRVVVAFPGRVQQGKVIRRNKNGNPFFLRLLVNAHRLARKRTAQHPVQFGGTFHGHGQMETGFAPPPAHPSELFRLATPFRKHIASGRSRTMFYLPDQQRHNPLFVRLTDGPHLFIQPVRPTTHPPEHILFLRHSGRGVMQSGKLVVQFERKIRRNLIFPYTPGQETPQQGKGLHLHVLPDRKFMNDPAVILQQTPYHPYPFRVPRRIRQISVYLLPERSLVRTVYSPGEQFWKFIFE